MGIYLRDLIHHSKRDKKLRAMYVYILLSEKEKMIRGGKKRCICRSWLMIVKGLKAFKIKM